LSCMNSIAANAKSVFGTHARNMADRCATATISTGYAEAATTTYPTWCWCARIIMPLFTDVMRSLISTTWRLFFRVIAVYCSSTRICVHRFGRGKLSQVTGRHSLCVSLSRKRFHTAAAESNGCGDFPRPSHLPNRMSHFGFMGSKDCWNSPTIVRSSASSGSSVIGSNAGFTGTS